MPIRGETSSQGLAPGIGLSRERSIVVLRPLPGSSERSHVLFSSVPSGQPLSREATAITTRIVLIETSFICARFKLVPWHQANPDFQHINQCYDRWLFPPAEMPSCESF